MSFIWPGRQFQTIPDTRTTVPNTYSTVCCGRIESSYSKDFLSMYLNLNKPVLSHLVMFSLKIYHSNQDLTDSLLRPWENSCMSLLGIQFCLFSPDNHCPLLYPPAPGALLRGVVYFLRAGVFLSGGNVMDRKTAWMVPMNPPLAHRAYASYHSSSAGMAIAPAHTSYVTLTKTALMGLMKTSFFAVRWIALCLLCLFL